METIVSDDIREATERSEKLREKAIALLAENGTVLKLSDWLTIKRYCERFEIKSESVVTNWIRRGVIPPENIRVIDDLNGLRLIKAVPYEKD